MINRETQSVNLNYLFMALQLEKAALCKLSGQQLSIDYTQLMLNTHKCV